MAGSGNTLSSVNRRVPLHGVGRLLQHGDRVFALRPAHDQDQIGTGTPAVLLERSVSLPEVKQGKLIYTKSSV